MVPGQKLEVVYERKNRTFEIVDESKSLDGAMSKLRINSSSSSTSSTIIWKISWSTSITILTSSPNSNEAGSVCSLCLAVWPSNGRTGPAKHPNRRPLLPHRRARDRDSLHPRTTRNSPRPAGTLRAIQYVSPYPPSTPLTHLHRPQATKGDPSPRTSWN